MATETPRSQPDRSANAHHVLWDDRLQDWLDGDQSETNALLFETHLSECEWCPGRLDEFQELESALRANAPPISLDAGFDAGIFSRIQAFDAEQRLAARQRIEQEMQSDLSALARSWRRTLAFVVPGAVAGTTLAFALAGHFHATDLNQLPLPQLVSQGVSALGAHASPSLAQGVFTAVFGASIGGLLAGWLAKTASY